MLPKYKRILLKLSGESLMGNKNFGLDSEVIARYAQDIKSVLELGVQVAVVIGGGNIYRGRKGAEGGVDVGAAEGGGVGGGAGSGGAGEEEGESGMEEPRGNRSRANQHAGIGGQTEPENRGANREEPCQNQDRPTDRRRERLVVIKLENHAGGNGEPTENGEYPGADRHGRPMLEDAQHVEEKLWASEVHHQQEG